MDDKLSQIHKEYSGQQDKQFETFPEMSLDTKIKGKILGADGGVHEVVVTNGIPRQDNKTGKYKVSKNWVFNEVYVKKYYDDKTDNDPFMHSNRFPSWEELDKETQKGYWLDALFKFNNEVYEDIKKTK